MSDVRRDRWGRYLVLPPDATKPVGYTRATTVAGWLDDKSSLVDWKATAAVVGLHRSPSLAAQWQTLLAEHDGDPWYASKESKDACKRLVEESAKAGGSQDRADIGTLLHKAFEVTTRTGKMPLLTPSVQADVAAYLATVAALGITVDPAHLEQMVVIDRLTVAGTADMLAIDVPGLGRMIADWKTGADLTWSWRSIALQLTLYSLADNTYRQGDNPDGSADVRGPMPAISRDHAVVFHVPAGEARCDVHVVPLRPDLVDLAFTLNGHRKERHLAIPLHDFLGTPAPVPMPTPAPEPTRGEQLAAVPAAPPDEGLLLDESAFTALREAQKGLTAEQVSFISDVVAESMRAQRSLHTTAGLTERRLHALSALLAVASQIDATTDAAYAGNTLRALISLVVEDDWPKFPNVTRGHALGVLDVDEARLVAELATRITAGGATSDEYAALGRLLAA